MADNNGLIEIRWLGRGGQGAVTSASLMAEAAINEGNYAQAFPSFGPERRGAPVAAFLRINNEKPIMVRAPITQPDVLVVFERRLLKNNNITESIKKNGLLVINSNKSAQELRQEFRNDIKLAVVNASKIAMEVIKVPIVNTTMVGALLKAKGVINIDSMLEPLQHRFNRLAEKNMDTMKRAYQETVIID